VPFARSLHPLIGQIPRFDNLHLLTGLGSSGFEKGFMAGKLFAESINHGAAVPILSEADPARQVSMRSM
jgi:glycine/D-amino acid oxidase-like deaminating enzyme